MTYIFLNALPIFFEKEKLIFLILEFMFGSYLAYCILVKITININIDIQKSGCRESVFILKISHILKTIPLRYFNNLNHLFHYFKNNYLHFVMPH